MESQHSPNLPPESRRLMQNEQQLFIVAAFPSGVHRRGGDNDGVHFTFPSPNCGHYENALRPPRPLPPSCSLVHLDRLSQLNTDGPTGKTLSFPDPSFLRVVWSTRPLVWLVSLTCPLEHSVGHAFETRGWIKSLPDHRQ